MSFEKFDSDTLQGIVEFLRVKGRINGKVYCSSGGGHVENQCSGCGGTEQDHGDNCACSGSF